MQKVNFFIVYNLLFNGLGGFKPLLQIGFPKKRIMRWKLTCRKFTGESPWGQQEWKEG